MAGYSVIEASDGAIGMQLYRTAPTDLVITDIHMPKRGGLEIIQELRTTFPMTRIFAISGDVGTEHDPLLLARQLGAMRTFRKPFDLREVLLAVHEVLHDTNATTSSSRSVPL
jgi:DNA-binding response OmpR family regulator